MRPTRLPPICFLLAAALPNATAQTVLFEGARLITGDGRAPIENSAFLVEGARFVQVGRKGEIRLPSGAARVDLLRNSLGLYEWDKFETYGFGSRT